MGTRRNEVTAIDRRRLLAGTVTAVAASQGLGFAEGEPQHADLERRCAEAPPIAVPTITLEGDANGAPHPDPSDYAGKFTGPYTHRLIRGGIGHNLAQEAPEVFADAVLEVAGA